jgi:hypothetical protein
MKSDRREAVRRRAHEIWEARGRPEGQHEDHWREAEAELARTGDQGNEGEGNKSAALVFDRSQTDFAQSADTHALGESAKKALEGDEAAALRKAEEKGRSRTRGEDPALSGKARADT